MVVLFKEEQLDEVFNQIASTIEFPIEGFLEEGPLSWNDITKKIGQEDAVFTEEVLRKMIEMGLIREQGELILLC